MVLVMLASLAFVSNSLQHNPFGSREGTFTRLEAEPISAAASAPLSASAPAFKDWMARIEQALNSTNGASPAAALRLRRDVFGRPRNVSLQVWRFVAQRFDAYFGDVSARKQLTLFLHFSKTGGTLFCDVATHNCAEHEVPEDNCNAVGEEYRLGNVTLALDDGAVWCPLHSFPVVKSCATRIAAARAHGLRFMGLERYLDGPPCHGIRYVTIMREPEARARSLLKHMIRAGGGRCVAGAREVRARSMHASAWHALKQHPALMNNHYTRSLLGPSAYALPLGGVVQHHLDLAKRVLSEAFELVLPLADLHSTAVSRMLRHVMCWQETNVTQIAREQGRASEFGHVKLLLDRADLLRQYNALDAELLLHARAIFAADRRYLMALRDDHSVAGLQKNCVCSARPQ